MLVSWQIQVHVRSGTMTGLPIRRNRKLSNRTNSTSAKLSHLLLRQIEIAHLTNVDTSTKAPALFSRRIQVHVRNRGNDTMPDLRSCNDVHTAMYGAFP